MSPSVNPATVSWMARAACALWVLGVGATVLPAQAAPLFESRDDLTAQADLRRLAEAEQHYWTEHRTYTRSFAELSPTPFEPRKEIFVQVEIADDKTFRAIAMPRRSTTARVFALVATEGQGSVIELGEEEVSAYVLGALKAIRKDQTLKLMLATVCTVSLIGLAVYGMVMHQRQEAGRWRATIPYLLGLIPLYMTLILSTYVDEHTYIGPLVIGMAGAGVLAGLLSIVFGVIALWQLVTQDEGFQLRRLALVGVLCAVLGMISPFYTFYPHLPWIGELTTRPASHRILPP
jgi:hypothetical protein